jgi:hypothetical protein
MARPVSSDGRTAVVTKPPWPGPWPRQPRHTNRRRGDFDLHHKAQPSTRADSELESVSGRGDPRPPRCSRRLGLARCAHSAARCRGPLEPQGGRGAGAGSGPERRPADRDSDEPPAGLQGVVGARHSGAWRAPVAGSCARLVHWQRSLWSGPGPAGHQIGAARAGLGRGPPLGRPPGPRLQLRPGGDSAGARRRGRRPPGTGGGATPRLGRRARPVAHPGRHAGQANLHAAGQAEPVPRPLHATATVPAGPAVAEARRHAPRHRQPV